MKLLVAGFGRIGREFVKLLVERKGALERKYRLRIQLAGIVDSRGLLGCGRGLSEDLVRAPRSRVSELSGGMPGIGVADALVMLEADVLVEATPSTYAPECPGIGHVLEAVSRGAHVITANKAPLALSCSEVMRRASNSGAVVEYKATVMAGVPPPGRAPA